LEPFTIVGTDLIDMHAMEIKGFTWALTAIDLFTRKGYCVPLKSKSAEDVIKGFALMLYGNKEQLRIHKHDKPKDVRKWTITRHKVKKPSSTIIEPQMTRHPKHLKMDNGPEFKNALFTYFLEHHTNSAAHMEEPGETNKNVISAPTTQHFTLPHTPQSNGCCERFNGFLKRQIKMQMVQNDDNDWVNMLPTILHNINSTWCRVINKSPNKAEKEFLETNDASIMRAQIIKSMGKSRQKNGSKPNSLTKVRFQVDDLVRVRLQWSKSAGLNWSHDIYKIVQVNPGSDDDAPIYRHTQYKLAACESKDRLDDCDEILQGVFYNDDLQLYMPVLEPVKGKERFVIESLVKPVLEKTQHAHSKAKRPAQLYEVKWMGYKEHTLEPRETLLIDVPHLVKRFEADRKVVWLEDKQPTYKQKQTNKDFD
jgi:hypothetical protein